MLAGIFPILAASVSMLLAIAAPQRAEAQVPSVTFTQTSGLCGVGSAGCGDFSATGSHLAANSRGDLFIPAADSNSQFIEEIPAKGGAPVAIFTGLNATDGGRAVFADKAGNLYYTYADNVHYSVDIVYVPLVNGAYPAASTYDGMVTCSAFPVPSTQTTACKVPLNYPNSLGYYVRAGDVALDGAGNLYILSKYDDTCNHGPCFNRILKWDTTNTFTQIAGSLDNNRGAEFAVTSAGDIYYEDGSGKNLYYAAGTTTQVSLSLYYITGVSVDAGDNVYFTQKNGGTGSSIIEFPFVGGTACHGSDCGDDQYTLSFKLGGYTSNPNLGVAITGTGKVFYLGDYPNSVNTLTVGNLVFGSTAVGTTTGTEDLLVTFGNNNSYKTFGSFTATGPFAVSSTTCVNGTTYGPYATKSCTVSLTYTASAPGPQSGSLQTFDSSGNLIGTASLSGTGAAPALNVDPGTVAAIGSAWTSPSAIATDVDGNVFVADSSTGKIYKTGLGSTTTTAVVSGFTAPSAVAVDGAGDLYVADSGKVFVVPYSGTYGTPSAILSGLSGPSGLALDPLGNLYVADSGNARVLLLASSGNQAIGSIVTTVGNGFTTPVAVALDPAGQFLYVSDSGAGKVFQLGLTTGSQTAVLSTLKKAAGVAVDAGGSLFAIDNGAKSLVRLPSTGGTLDANSALTLSQIVATPTAVALDAAGNVYVTDTTGATVGRMDRTLGSLTFGRLNVLDSSSTVSATLSSAGTQPLVFNTPYFTASGSTNDFALQGSSTCADGATLSPGSACTIAEVFTPQTAGALTEALAFASNVGTASSLTLSGTGVQLAKTTITLGVTSPTGTPFYGQPVVVTATVIPVVSGGPAPTGTVTFYVDSVAQIPSVSLTGTTAAVTVNGLLAGAHTVTASFTGDDNYAYIASSALTLTVAKAATTASIVVSAPFTDPTSANPPSTTTPQSITLTSIVTPVPPAKPTGTVTFLSGTTVLGTAPVLQVTQKDMPDINVATLVLTNLQLGQYAISSVYSGDANFATSASAAALPLLISAPTIAMTSSATSIGASGNGGGSSVTFTINSVAGFNNTADLSCSGLPKFATCSFSPPFATTNQGVPAVITLKVLVDQPPVIAVPAGLAFFPTSRGGGLLALLSLLPLAFAAWKLRRAKSFAGAGLFAMILMLGCAALFTGCGAGSGVTSYTTPRGTSTIQVNATISSTPVAPNPPATLSIPLQLTVN